MNITTNTMTNLFEEIVKMDSIVHFDEMNTDDFITFVRSFIDIEQRNIEISEKMDGMNFSFGVDENNKFYSKTKSSKPVTDPSVYGDFNFLQGIKDYHRILNANERFLVSVKEKIAEYQEINALQVFGELLPSSETNIVKYDKDKIGKGAIVLFDVKVDGKSILRQRYSSQIFKMLVDGLDNSGGWRAYSKPLVDSSQFKFEVNHLITLESLYRKYFDIIKSRKKVDKPTKLKAKKVIQMVMDNIKGQFLKQMVINRKSVLGNIEPEGLILRDFKNNLLVKLVDKDAFTAANQAGSQYIKPVMMGVKKTNDLLRNDVFGNADIMKNFAKVIEKSVDWAFTQRQIDPTFKVQTVDDLLKVAYDDMVKEGRLKYKAPKALKITVGYLKQFRKIITDNERALEIGKADIPASKYIISKEKMEVYLQTVDDTINQLKTLSSDNGMKIYLTIIAFTFGANKLRELKAQFNLK